MSLGRPGLYLHVPYCSAICPYCDFAVRKGDEDKARAFTDALIAEIRGVAEGRLLPEATDLATAVERLAGATFGTVYFGGGTPSILAPDDLERLVDALRDAFDLAADTRWFLEANPEDLDAERMASWKTLGVSMLSLGVQALDDTTLHALGRRHSADDAIRAIERAASVGFDTVSIDLIYGLPAKDSDADPEAWGRQLDRALALPIDHLSLYELEIHERTAFGKRHARGELVPLDQDRRADLFLTTHRRLADAGWDGYEVSNFARTPEHRSAHNAKYWHHVPYLGLGPSAHSLAVDPDVGAWRFWNERLEPRWRRHLDDGLSPAAGWERLPASALALEAAMLGLRTRDGLDLDHVERLSGIDLLATDGRRIDTWIERGWIRLDGRWLRPSAGGMAIADRLAADLTFEG
ncbi:MAG: radical SAM family heme chaperone HemW [Acidobacteriota bacterium]